MIKKKVLLTFSSNLTGKPFSYNLIKNYNLKINILRATIDYNIQGSLLMEIEGVEENINLGISYLEQNGVSVENIEAPIAIDKDKCIDCGTCVAACSVGALIMNSNWELAYDSSLCMECMLCLKACPLRIIKSTI